MVIIHKLWDWNIDDDKTSGGGGGDVAGDDIKVLRDHM